MSYDTHKIFREVTVRLNGEPDIRRALSSVTRYLKDLIPIEDMVLLDWEEFSDSHRILLHVTGDAIEGERTRMEIPSLEDAIVTHRRRALENLPSTFVRRLEDMKGIEIDKENREEILREMGFAPESSVVFIGMQELHSAIAMITSRPSAFTEEHVYLLDRIKEPFVIAVGNALHFDKIDLERSSLKDDNEIFREASRRLTGKLDIKEALHDALLYLKRLMPVDELLLFRVDRESKGFHVVVRTDEHGIQGEEDTLLFLMPDKLMQEVERPQTERRFPEIFILDEAIKEEQAAAFAKLDVPMNSSVLLMIDYEIQAGIMVACRQPGLYGKQHVRLFRMLKDQFSIAVSNAVRFYELKRMKDMLADDNRAMQAEIRRSVGDRVVGADGGLRGVMILVSQVARTSSPVLLLGETGTGKEVVATAIHRASARSSGPMVSINCGAIPETLLDSELFGHEKGAFTGATERKRGRFERADGGTLFLDEIGELPHSAQVKLLRVLQTKEFERVGGSSSIRSDVRLIAATHRDLPAMVRSGQFREDLWFRLNVFPVEIPPLRERREDIPALTYHFIESKSREMNLSVRPPVLREGLDRLMAYDWPGNVRELQNAIERALILNRGGPLAFPGLSNDVAVPAPPADPSILPDTGRLKSLDEVVAAHLTRAIQIADGKISGPTGAAALVGLNASTFRSKMKKLGLRRVHRGEVVSAG